MGQIILTEYEGIKLSKRQDGSIRAYINWEVFSAEIGTPQDNLIILEAQPRRKHHPTQTHGRPVAICKHPQSSTPPNNFEEVDKW